MEQHDELQEERETDTPGRSVRRSHGLQARSRERIEQLLTAAQDLISTEGFDGLKMRELARAAGLPIASVYHYFPSNAAVVRALAERHLSELRVVLLESTERHIRLVDTPEKAPVAVGLVVRDVTNYLRESRYAAPIWDALKAVPELRALDIEDTAQNARFIEPYIARAFPHAKQEQLTDFCLVLIEAVQSNIMVIIKSAPERQERLIDTLVRFVSAAISKFEFD